MADDIDTAIAEADHRVMISGNRVIRLDDLLVPDFIQCHRCPKQGNCPAQEASEREDANHCLIEEGLVIEATRDLMNYYDITIKDKLVLFSFMINLLNLHRLSRMGTKINYNLANDEDNMDIMNKYMAMLAKIDGRYHKGLTELQATRKEQTRLLQHNADQTGVFIQLMKDMALKTKQRETIGEGNGQDSTIIN